MSCEDIPSLLDLQNTKKHVDDFGRLMGTDEGDSTNEVTGQTRPTYNKVMKSVGFKPGSGDFTTGFTVMPGERDIAWYDPVSLNWYSYLGVIPTSGYVVAPTTNPVGDSDWAPRTDEVLRVELAGHSGASLIGFGMDNASSIFSDTLLSPESQGAIGDGVTDDTTEVNSAIGFAGGNIVLRKGSKYKVTSETNPLGVPMDGTGMIVKSATGGLEAQNTYADRYQRVTGQENLATWYKLLYTQHITPTRAPRIVFSGDSTTAGDGVDAEYKIDILVRTGLADRGLQSPYNTAGVNKGHSGAHTGQWETTFVNEDIAEAPDLYVLRWGINDPGWLKNGNPAPLDAGQSYPNRRDVNDFANSLRNGLATFRAAKPFSTTSVLLMMPNSTYDIPNARDALWYEQLRNVYIQAARDFQCAFIDTYAIMQDSRYLANILMDDPFGDGRGIHPNNAMNSIIAGHILDLIAPEGLRYNLASNKFFSIGGSGLVLDAALQPDAYKAAVYMLRALPVNGWPLDGHVITFRTVDNSLIQYHFGYSNADRGKMKIRYGRAVALGGEAIGWSQWFDMTMMGGSSDVTPETGFELPVSGKMRVAFTGTMACFDGFISKSSPTTVPANTVIATIAVGYTPVREAAYGTATVWDGASFEQVPCVITPAGHIRIAKTTTLSVDRVYINVTYDNRP